MGLYDHKVGAPTKSICTLQFNFQGPTQERIPQCASIVKVWLYKSITEQSSRRIIQIIALPPWEIYSIKISIWDSLQYCAILESNLHMIGLVLVGFSFKRKWMFFFIISKMKWKLIVSMVPFFALHINQILFPSILMICMMMMLSVILLYMLMIPILNFLLNFGITMMLLM